jgi:hypothetical protein
VVNEGGATRRLQNVVGALDSRRGLFGSRTIAAHLVRGVIAAGALTWTMQNWVDHPALGLIGLGVALVAMRGCPMCWTVGLVETVVARVKRSQTAEICECRIGKTSA